MLLPRAAMCVLAFPLLVGCDHVKETLGSQDLSCNPAEKPGTFKGVHDGAYVACRTLWPEQLRKLDGNPWLARMLFNADSVAFSVRQGLLAAGGPMELACDDRLMRKHDVAVLAAYRRSSASFFRTYFSAPVNEDDDGMMVVIAGLAPADAGRDIVIGAMNAFKVPTEKASAKRDRRGEFTQLLKSAFFYNAAADRVTKRTRYRRKHGRLKVKPADAAFAREQLSSMKGILKPINPKIMNEEQRKVYKALSEASSSLARSF